MIELKNVEYRYVKDAAPAVYAVNASIRPGIHLLLGENGAGKTTLNRIIAGQLIATHGECFIDDVNVALRLPAELRDTVYLGTGTTFPLRTIAAMARHHAPFYPNFSSEMLNENLEAFGIDPTKKLSSMSFGMRQKAMVAYVISLNTNVLLLDEPTIGLDIESKSILQSMIAKCAGNEKTIIVSTHTISDLLNLYDGVMVMRAGRLVLNSYSDEISERIEFVSSFSDVPGAIYSQWIAGQMHSIVPSGEVNPNLSRCGSVDYQLLYSALHSPVASQLLNILNN